MNKKCWKHGLAAAFITGFANSGFTALGITSASSVGINIQQLNLRQIVAVTIIGGFVGAFAYLKQSPLPDENDTCDITIKPTA
jgi:hypothetical protein